MGNNNLTDSEVERDILFGVINRFIGYFTRATVPKTSNDTTREYPFVAMDTRQAYEQLLLARTFLDRRQGERTQPYFLDIGCGIGNILLLAEMMGFAAYGIEKDTVSLEIAKQLVGEEQVSREDIWSFNRWRQFDVVYYFRPFCEKSAQLRFERLVEEGLKPGAVLIANRKMSVEIDRDPRFDKIDPQWPVWCKV